jgi:quinol monooxygenase YgiN
MSEIVVVGVLKARPGKEAEAEHAMRSMIEPTHAEAGCGLYAFHRGADDPARFAFIERWASREALDEHLATPHVSGFIARADELLAEPVEVTIYEALPAGDGAKGALAD